jgi:hypothetical protein
MRTSVRQRQRGEKDKGRPGATGSPSGNRKPVVGQRVSSFLMLMNVQEARDVRFSLSSGGNHT